MNRLTNYIHNMRLTRQYLKEARIAAKKDNRALLYLIFAFEAFVSATNCVISLRDKKKPK